MRDPTADNPGNISHRLSSSAAVIAGKAIREPSIYLLLFLIYLFLIHPIIFLNLSEINPYDEAAYINSGRTFLAGSLPTVAGNPLVDLLYAITYLPFSGSPYWLVQSAMLGRLVLLSLLWLSTYLIATQLGRRITPVIMLGFLIVTPLAVEMVRFPSDPLFASLAGLTFWQLLSFYHDPDTRHLWYGSAFMGLATLARNDGLVLGLIFIALSILLSVRRTSAARALLASLIPFLAITGGYILLRGVTTGSYEIGTMRRTYDNFEAGQQSIFAGTGEIGAVAEAKAEARRIFGTPQENNYSVLAAILRNPGVYFQRVAALAKGLPSVVLQAYGIRFATIFLLLAVWGGAELVRTRQFRLLAVFLIWPLYFLTGFVITIFREGHLQFHYYVVYGLAAIGLAGLLRNLDDRRVRYLWYLVLGLLLVYGLLANKLAIYLGAVVFLFALWLVHLVSVQYRSLGGIEAVVLLILLASGIILHGNYPSPRLLTLGVEAKERAAVFMSETLPAGAKVAAGSPAVVWMARMDYAGLSSPDVPKGRDPQGFLDWMVGQGIEAIYVDHSLYNTSPAIWNLIKPQIGAGIERVFVADEGDIQVLLIRSNQ